MRSDMSKKRRPRRERSTGDFLRQGVYLHFRKTVQEPHDNDVRKHAARTERDCRHRYRARAGLRAVQFQKAYRRRIFEFNLQVIGDEAERVVHVRQVAGGHVVDEGALDFVIAHAAMQPAQEDDELREQR